MSLHANGTTADEPVVVRRGWATPEDARGGCVRTRPSPASPARFARQAGSP